MKTRSIMPAFATTARRMLLAVAVLTVVFVGVLKTSAGRNPNPSIAPPNSAPYGKTYAEWHAAWWQWAYSMPVTGHPLFDETGAAVATGQSGPVWFLGGVFNVSGSATRHVTVPAGKALFFPILNIEWDNAIPPYLTEDELRALAGSIADAATDVACEIDGVPVADINDYRTSSPLFSFTLPETDNIFQFFGIDVSGTVAEAVDDGWYLMLSPLSRGQHTIHFHGSFPTFGFTLDITYHITVE